MPQGTARRRPLPDSAEWKRLRCSFCGKHADHVSLLAAGVFGGTICDRCCLKALLVFLKARLASALRIAAA